MKKIPIYLYFFIIGGIIASICSYFTYKTLSFEKNAIQVVGVVKDFRWSNKGGCSPNLAYQVEQRDYMYQPNTFISPCPYSVGGKVEMLYSFGSPEDVIMDSFIEKWLFTSLFGIMTSISVIVGLFFLRKEQKKQWLIRNGIRVTTHVKEVSLNTHLTVNGQHPWIIISHYDDGNGNIYVYESENIWFDPSEYITSTITVFVNPIKYNQHYMDISFLPDLK